MGTIADKLAKLNSTKAALKSAINGSGNTVGDVFADYPPAVSNGRAGIAAAITEKGVQTSADAPFDVLETNVRAIEAGGGTVIGTLNQISFLPELSMAWSDGETGHYESIGGPHDAISVIKNSCIYLQGFQSISGGVSEIKYSSTIIGGAKVYFVYDDFTLIY